MEKSYDRLINMYQKQQTEQKDKALAYKIELEKSREYGRVLKTENEKLKEINETQQKLWKIFTDKFEKKEEENAQEKSQRKTQRKSKRRKLHRTLMIYYQLMMKMIIWIWRNPMKSG